MKSGIIRAMPITGVFAAALTPLREDYSADLDAVPGFLAFLAERGCHGALLMGTTGEGPSFNSRTRVEVLRAALTVREEHPEFKILLGTGTPSLEETILLTRSAYEHGADGVVVLPPYYFRSAGEEGLLKWFSAVLQAAVPQDACFLAYHIPAVTGVPISLSLLSQLKDRFPRRFQGLKDSSGDAEHARLLGERFGRDLLVFNGSDRLFSHALQQQAAGCITALANLYSPYLRQVWDAHQKGEDDGGAQDFLTTARSVSDRYPPAAPLLKALLARQHHLPLWQVCPPLLACPEETAQAALEQLSELDRSEG
jgi:4-hydroxy-tetrahydrodipicolinate synthase